MPRTYVLRPLDEEVGLALRIAHGESDVRLSRFRHAGGKARRSQELDHGHREPPEVRPFLGLRPAVDVPCK